MKKYYVFENDFDVEIFEDKQKAIDTYKYILSRLTETEKSKKEYFRLYEIEKECEPSNLEGDLIDHMTEMIFKLA